MAHPKISLGGPNALWPTQKMPVQNKEYSYCFQCLRNLFVNFRLDSFVRLTVSILPADCGVTAKFSTL
jgi:hypothetical protein